MGTQWLIWLVLVVQRILEWRSILNGHIVAEVIFNVMQRTPEMGKHTPEPKSVDSSGQQQQAQAQPASWSAIAAQGAAKGSGSPPAAGASGRSHGSGLSNRGSATDLRQEQVRVSLTSHAQAAYACSFVSSSNRNAAPEDVAGICWNWIQIAPVMCRSCMML